MSDNTNDSVSSFEQDQNIHYLSEVTSIQGEEYNKDFTNIDCRCLLSYKTPADILESLNVDQRTVFDNAASDSASLTSVPIDEIERTLAIIKPSIMCYANKIETRIRNEGFTVLQKRCVHLTPEEAADFYKHLYGTVDFPTIIVDISSAPIYVYCMTGVKALSHWRDIMKIIMFKDVKPVHIRRLNTVYGNEYLEHALHGSTTLEMAEREIHFFFPSMIIEPLPTSEDSMMEIFSKVKPTLLEGLAQLCKAKPLEPIVWFADWLLLNNPFQPKLPDNIARTAS